MRLVIIALLSSVLVTPLFSEDIGEAPKSQEEVLAKKENGRALAARKKHGRKKRHHKRKHRRHHRRGR